MTSDAGGEGGFSQIWFYKIGFTNKTSDEGGGGVKKGPKSSDVIYGRPLKKIFTCNIHVSMYVRTYVINLSPLSRGHVLFLRVSICVDDAVSTEIEIMI